MTTDDHPAAGLPPYGRPMEPIRPRTDADRRRFLCSGDLAHVQAIIRRHYLADGAKPASADLQADRLAAKLFDQMP